MSNPERVQDLLEGASELPPERRRAYLDAECAGDANLRDEVESLLRSLDEAGRFLSDPAGFIGEEEGRSSFSSASGTTRSSEHAGQMIGRYKLLQPIGEGGFGSVWMAEQREPVKRRVALKIIKLGMDTKQVIARFEAERQAVAIMDHHNIAKVLDAGATEAGRPYFVMEYINGVSIVEYCESERLDTRARLELFTQVCQAIQHAHQKGIIHRDIKPSNVLVTMHDGVPVPKVIDFGIAKATGGELTAKTLFTEHWQLIGTPAYMSPEQAEMSGIDIDTRSDIYSLGVLLYELLTGSPPFDTSELMSKGFEEMMRIIREVTPRSPSTRLSSSSDALAGVAAKRHTGSKRLGTIVRGELDWIVMKALEKDRQRRYETAIGLAMDIRRYLSGEAVVAAPPSTGYQLRKFVTRNRGIVTATSAVATALLIGLITFAWQAKIARDAQTHATVQQGKAEAERDRGKTQLTRAEWLIYAGKLTLAQSDFEDGDGGLALHYLGECQPERRGWEWRYLWTRINAGQNLTGHDRDVSSVAFSPDGRRVVTGSQDGTAKVWEATTGAQLFTLRGHRGFVLGVAFSPDGQRIVTGAGVWGEGRSPGEVKVWDAATGQLVHDLTGHSYCVWSVAFSPDGQRIVSGAGDWGYGPGEAKVWSALTGEEVLALAVQSVVRSVAFSADGERIFTGGEEWSAPSTKPGEAMVWDAATGRRLLTLGHGKAVASVAFSPDGQRIVTGSGEWRGAGQQSIEAKVWNAATGQELVVLRGHKDRVFSVSFNPDGGRIVTGSGDRTARVWDAVTGSEILAIKGHAGAVRSVAFSPDGRRIVTGSQDRTAKIWDAENGQEVPTLKGHADFVSSIAFSPDGRWIVTGSGDSTAKVWETATCREVLTLGSTRTAWSEAGIWGVAFSPDGRFIVSGSNDTTAKVWDAATGQVVRILEHPDVVSSVAFSPDGRRIATGCGAWSARTNTPGDARIWDATSGEELLVLNHADVVSSVAFSPDGRHIVTGSGDMTAKVWDATTGQELLTLKGHTKGVRSVAFSPDGQRVLSGGLDGTAKVWDAATGRELLSLTGHTGAVHSVTFMSDGQRIVTGSDDRTAKVWDAGTGYELLSLKGHAEAVWSVACSPDGQRVVTGIAGANAVAKVWYAAPARR